MSTQERFEKFIKADPGLPRINGSKPYWLSVPHSLAEIQSQSLPELADVVVIGSGITGTSVAHSLLETPGSEIKVTVLEARGLCSGATGRNGGNLLSYGPALYSILKEAAGQEMAFKMLDYFDRTVVATKNMVDRYAPEASEARSITRIHTWTDAETFAKVKEGVLECHALRPETKKTHVLIDGETALKEHNLHGVAGAIKYPGNALWPYRFIMSVWEALRKRFPTRLSIEANTPVTDITYEHGKGGGSSDAFPYVLHTPRGLIRASRVVHCTNGYAGHLLPGLRGIIWPCRETVTVRDLQESSGRIRGDKESWAIVQQPETDPESEAVATSLLYLQQNAKSGYWFIGGGLNTADEILTADDSDMDLRSADYLSRRLREFIGVADANDTMVSSWTGIQGMTSDNAPLAGNLPEELTGRKGQGEWIAAGYNGGGMCISWLAGETLVKMMQGHDVPEWFPESFLLSDARLETSLNLEASLLQAEDYLG